MASSAQTRTIRQGWPLLPGVLVLAGQRVRKTWGLLLAIELGMLGAVLLACVVPLYANIAMTAALRGTLNTSPQNSDIVVRTLPQLVSAQVVTQTTQILDKELGKTLGPYLDPVQFSIETQSLPLLAPNQQGVLKPTRVNTSLISADIARAAAHLTLIEGRLPKVSGNTLEVAVTPETLPYLHATLGGVLAVSMNFTDVYNKIYPQILLLHIVGLFRPAGGN